MKFAINREIKSGKYIVAVSVKEITDDERAKIIKFGAPMVSISPKAVLSSGGYSYTSTVPLHSLNYVFEFSTKDEADDFNNNLLANIKEAVQTLKNYKDDFSLSKEYDF